jgi:hypothetical protein
MHTDRRFEMLMHQLLLQPNNVLKTAAGTHHAPQTPRPWYGAQLPAWPQASNTGLE